jgi:acyl-CoA thioester hydrolase
MTSRLETDTSGVIYRKRIYLDDLDGFGMLHHARYALLFDGAVIDYWVEAGWLFDPDQAVMVVRELQLTFHAPVIGIQDVDVRFWIDRASATHVTYCFEVLSVDHAIKHAEGTRVLVNLDPRTLRPSPISETVWELAKPLLGAGFVGSRDPL